MGLNKGSENKVTVIQQDRSKEYVDALNEKLLKIKNDIKDEQEKYDALVLQKNELLKEFAQSKIDGNAEIETISLSIINLTKELKEIQLQKSETLKTIEDEKASFDRIKQDFNEWVNQKKVESDNFLSDVNDSLKEFSLQVDEKKKELSVLSGEIEALTALKSSLLQMTEEIKREKSFTEEETKRLKAEAESNKAEAKKNKDEVNSLKTSAQSISEQIKALQDQIDKLLPEKEAIIKQREANTKRAKELADMAQDLRVESVALANKNAYLLKKEAQLKDAQTKIQ